MRWLIPKTKSERELFDTDRVLVLDSGKHHVVDGVFCKAGPGDLVAHEVLVTGTAEVTAEGMMHVVGKGGIVRAGCKVVVDAWGGRVESDGADVYAHGGKVVARRGVVYAEGRGAVIEAEQAIVVRVKSFPRGPVSLRAGAQLVEVPMEWCGPVRRAA
jgi:hypothetical protein